MANEEQMKAERKDEVIHRDLSELINPQKAIHNTGIAMKRRHFDKFVRLIGNQFRHGGDKYALDNQPDKEFTDLVCEVAPGKTGFDWIFQTIVKYCGRYINFQREKDLLKIATYCYIAWLKAGCHLEDTHDEDTSRDGEAIQAEPKNEQEPVEDKKPSEPLLNLESHLPLHSFAIEQSEEETDA